MTNDELRLAIAKIMGWADINHDLTGAPPKSQWPKGMIASGNFYSIPNWPTSIIAAWELVDEARLSDVGVIISNSLTFTPIPGIWSYTVAFYDPIGGPMSSRYDAEADTVMRAICMAYMAWKEGHA